MKKLATKLMISVLSVALAFIALGTSTFAWFSMNTTVEASGMQLTAVTPINLLIGDKETDTTPESFENKVLANENFGTFKLYPASSADGKLFTAVNNSGNYIKNGIGGAADDDTKFQISSNQPGSKVVSLTNARDGYWADYTFQLKLSQHQETAAKVFLSKLNFYAKVTVTASTVNNAAGYYTYNESTGVFAAAELTEGYLASGEYYQMNGIANACRAALFVGDASGSVIDFENDDMLALYSTTADTAEAITAAVTTPDTVYTATTHAATASVAPSNAESYRFDVNDTAVNVVLRVWIEGQDTNCVNAVAGQTFRVELAFDVYQAPAA